MRREAAPPTPTERGAEVASAVSIERSRLSGALHGLRHGCVIVDAAGHEVYRNVAAERYREARHADAVAAGAIAELLERARTGTKCIRELQLFGPPRSVLQIEAIPVVTEGELVGAAAFVYDVSEIHRVESVRRDFVANVSHELKTPIGALEILADTLASESDPAVTRPLAERMLKEADRLSQIVDDLLDLSLIETQESPRREPVPVEVLLEDATDRVRRASEAARIEIEIDDAVPGTLVSCDRRQMVSAIANLLDNAVKYSEPGSRVRLSASIAVSDLMITVSDEGIGIPGRDLERIFERFYRVDQARSRDTGGTGLGLAIVRHVAQAHGGEVGVTSREGEGSTFRIALPLESVGLNATKDAKNR